VAVPLIGKILLDTNVFIDYLRAGRHGDWVWGGAAPRIRFLSAVVVLELRLGAETPRRRRAVDRIVAAFPPARILAPTTRLFERAGHLFHRLYPGGHGFRDRLDPIDDLLIAR
jgi:predicted nucleic acid-binding protein